MNKKMLYFLYSVILALGVISSFFFHKTGQKILLTILVTAIFFLFYVYNKKNGKEY